MEPITHILTGYQLSKLWQPREKNATFAILLGVLFPDIDHIFVFWGERYYLKYHRTFTHSIITAPLFAFLLATLIKQKNINGRFIIYFLSVLIGTFSHLLLDLIVPYGIKLLYPWGNWYTLNWVYVIDIPLFIFLIFSFFLQKSQLINEKKMALITITLMICFFCFRGYLSFQVINYFHHNYKEYIKMMAMPTPFNPFEWTVIVEKTKNYDYFRYNLLNKKIYFKKIFLKTLEEIELIKSLPLCHTFLSWAKFPIVEKVFYNSEKKFFLRDLRFYHPKRYILTVRVTFNKRTKEVFLFR